jgi:hypothetical protein
VSRNGQSRRNALVFPEALATNKPLEPVKYQGAFVYKYRSVKNLEWLKEILEGKLYFPTARELNDPEEARPRLVATSPEALARAVGRLYAKTKPDLTDQDRAIADAEIGSTIRRSGTQRSLRMMKRNLDPLFARFRIYSLSKRPDNMHLWRKYAEHHTGYCLEFRNGETFGPIFEVQYKNNLALDLTDENQLEPYFLFYKTRSWLEEEEVRMINQQNSDSNATFDPRLLTRIILGRKIAQTDAARIRTWAAACRLPATIVSELDTTPNAAPR